MISSVQNINDDKYIYVKRSSDEKQTGKFLAINFALAAIPKINYFSKPFMKQVVKELGNNPSYKSCFLKCVENSGLKEKGLSILNVNQSNKYLNPSIAEGMNASYGLNTKQIMINLDKASAAGFHELGHAMNNLGSKFGLFLQKSRNPATVLSKLMILPAFYTKEDKNPFLVKYAWALSALVTLPILMEEGLASYKGIKIAKQNGLNNKLVKNLKKLYSKALLSYFGSTAITALSAFAVGKITQYYEKPKKIKIRD